MCLVNLCRNDTETMSICVTKRLLILSFILLYSGYKQTSLLQVISSSKMYHQKVISDMIEFVQHSLFRFMVQSACISDSGPDCSVFNLRVPPGNLRLHFAVLLNAISHYCFMMLQAIWSPENWYCMSCSLDVLLVQHEYYLLRPINQLPP